MKSPTWLQRLRGSAPRNRTVQTSSFRAVNARRVFFERLECRRLLAVDLDFGSLFNQDSIRNRFGGSDDLVDSSIDGCCRLVTDAYAQNRSSSGNGLPDNGAFAPNAFHPPVQLGYSNNDDGDNVVFLPDSGDSVTVDVPTPAVRELHIFALSANGVSNMEVTLIYADGVETLTTRVADWFHEVADGDLNGDAIRYNLIDGMDRADDVFRDGFDAADDPAVFGHRFDVNPQRLLEGFTITNTNSLPDPNLVVLGATAELDALGQFAQALADAGVRFSGTTTADAVGRQRALFGANQALLPFVDDASGDPTWEFQDGTRLEGFQPLATLSQFSGIPLPPNVISIQTNVGRLELQLLVDEAPNTVFNFLRYVNGGVDGQGYTNSILHRSDENFVIQGGGFRPTSLTTTDINEIRGPFNAQTEDFEHHIPTFDPIPDERGAGSMSNTFGTYAMAKNSAGATSEHYFNFGDNSFLDGQGFTVFAVDPDALNPDGTPNTAATISLIHGLTRVDVDPSNDATGGFSVFDNVPFTGGGEMVYVQSIDGSGTVRGTVFNDLDRDGVQSGGELGLAGVVVFSDANGNGTAEDGEFSAITNADGMYTLVLPTGSHTIRQQAVTNTLQTAPRNPDGFILDVEIGGEFSDIRFGIVAPVTIDKDFDPPNIGPGSVSTLTFDIINDGATGALDLAFTDVLPEGLTIAAPARARSACGGTITAPDGGNTIAFSEGIIAAGGQCSITVDVTSSTIGDYTNVTGTLSSNAGSSGGATAVLSVDAELPGFSKSFSPAAINFGSRSTLTFTIDNTANDSGVTGLRFIDALPSGMVVASPANARTDCGTASFVPSLTANAGTDIIDFVADGFLPNFPSLAGGASCTVTVDVIGHAVGRLGNTTGKLTTSSIDQEISSGKAAAVLEVTASEILLTKSFKDDPVPPGATVDVEFTVMNRDRSSAATNVTFTDDLDATLSGFAAVGLPLGDVCGAGSMLSGTGLLTLSGANLDAGGSCTFSATLQVPANAVAGSYPNTTSDISADVAGATVTGNPASDTLFVSAGPILTTAFIDDPVGAGGVVLLRFTIENTSQTSAATNIGFQDELTTFLPFPLSANLPSSPCGDGSEISVESPGTDRHALSLTGGTLAASGSCSFDVSIDIPSGVPGGAYLNTTSEIAATVDGVTATGEPASDTLVIVESPTLDKQFIDDPVLPGETATLEFTINYGDEGTTGDATGIAFTDDLGAALSGLVAVGLPASNVCGVGSQLTGTDTLSLTGARLSPGVSCTFSVDVTVPQSALPGNYTNTTSGITATVLGVETHGATASDDLKVGGLSLSKSFMDDPVIAGGNVTLEFTISNSSTLPATNIVFSDNLSAALTGLAAVALPADGSCGAGSTMTGTSTLIFQGGSLNAGQSCTFSATLQVPAGVVSDSYANVTSNLFADLNGASVTLDPANDILVVNSDLLSITKAFSDDQVAPGGMTTLLFTLTNLDSVRSATEIAFTDDLNAALANLSALDSSAADVCGAGSQLSGTGLLTFNGGTLGPGGSCSFSVTVEVPSTSPLATTATNTTSSVTGKVNGLAVRGVAATDSFLVETSAATRFDFGDAPTAADTGFASSYPVTLAQNGARHGGGLLFLGQKTDPDEDGQPDADALGDDNDGSADEDGVVAIASIVAATGTDTVSSFAVTASSAAVAGGAGKLDAWIDFNQDGDWDEANEQIFNTVDVAPGLNVFSFSIPAGATPGQTGARFRISSTGGLASTGAATDGEVEDYIFAVRDGDATGGAIAKVDPPSSGTLDVVASGNDVVVRSGAIELFRAPGSALSQLDVAGLDGDDTLNLADLDAIFGGLVTGDAGAGRDTLRLTGGGQVLDLTQIPDADIQGLEEIDISGSGDNTLSLNVDEVLNISTTTDTLRVVHDDGDTVNYGTGWTVELPQIIASQFVHVLKQGTGTIEVANRAPFRNPFRSLDTNRDGSVSPLDALIIVNRLNSTGSGPLSTPTSVAGLTEFFYIDTNGDRFVSPVDVIRVVNFLNQLSINPEGESSVRTAIIAALAQPPMLRFNNSVATALQRDDSSRRGLRRTELYSVPTEYNAVLRRSNPPRARHRRVAVRPADVAAAALHQFFAEQDASSLRTPDLRGILGDTIF